MPDPHRLATELRELADDLSERSPSREQASAIKDKAAELEAALGDGEVTDIDAFFSAVGDGVLKAQRELDQQSHAYLAENPPYASVFRIPKASAEFQFAISSFKGRKMNLLVYGSRENQERSVQQRVSFDVVSAPPPVEMRDDTSLGRALVGDLFVRDLFERALAGFRDDQAADSAIARRAQAFLDGFDRVLVLRGRTGWALLLPFQQRDGSWDLDAFLVGDHEEGIVPAAVRYVAARATQPPGKSLARILGLAAFLEELASLQAERLAALRERRAHGEPEGGNPGVA